MPKTPNPLLGMTDAIDHNEYQQGRSETSFTEITLPDFKQALNARRAIREYDGMPISKEVIRDCLKDAALAPSLSNLQTCELCWVRGSGKKGAVAKAVLANLKGFIVPG